MKQIILILVIILSINCSTFENSLKEVCEGKLLSTEQCTKYLKLRDNLQNCFEVSTNKCENPTEIHKRICYIQSEVRCFLKFYKSLKLSYIPNDPTKCALDAECGVASFCSRPRGVLLGLCKLRHKYFCRDNSHCPTTTFCKHDGDSSHGHCTLLNGITPLNFTKIYEPIKIIEISAQDAEEYAKTLDYVPESNINPLEQETKKGTYEIDMLSHESQTSILENARTLATSYNIPSPCGYYTCDNPNFRNLHTTPLNYKYKIIFIWFSCVTGYDIKGKAALQTAKLNERYKGVGLSFVSEVRIFPCNGKQNIPIKDWESVIVSAVGSDASHGAFAVLVGKVSDNSWAFNWLPGQRGFWSYGAMDDPSYPTQTHELAHGFGLYHTFDSNPDGSCTQCYEKSGADGSLRGDFCSDTPPHVAFEGCATTFKKNGYCGDTRTSWTNPATNYMSYGGECRKEFTAQQIKRSRCYAKNHLPTLKRL